MPRRHRPDSNGAVWRKVRAAVLRTEDVCALCGQFVDKSLPYLDPMSAQVDHIIPFAKGGHPTARWNLQLSHRKCNRSKGDGTFKAAEPIRTSRAW